MTAIPEVFRRRTRAVSIAYQLAMPAKVLESDIDRLWASVVCGQFDVPVAVTTNPLAQIGDPDTCVFLPGQGAVFFETYGTNELYIIGLPVGTPVAICTVQKEKRLSVPTGRSVRCATRCQTVTGNVDLTYAGGKAAFLPEDNDRSRIMVKGDTAFGALSTIEAAPTFDFMPLAPFFPGYCVLEGTEELVFLDFATGPTNAGYIMDRQVSAT